MYYGAMLRSPLQVWFLVERCQRTLRITDTPKLSGICEAIFSWSRTRECITYFIRGDAALAPSGELRNTLC